MNEDVRRLQERIYEQEERCSQLRGRLEVAEQERLAFRELYIDELRARDERGELSIEYLTAISAGPVEMIG